MRWPEHHNSCLIVQKFKRFFHGKRHDNKFLKVKILLLRSFVVMAQAPTIYPPNRLCPFTLLFFIAFLAEMGENARFKNGHARVETRSLKTLACRNGLDFGPLLSNGRQRVGAF